MYMKTRCMSKADQQAHTCAALLAAGTKLSAEHGYHETTIDDVARDAGFSRVALHAIFHDKGDLVLTVLEAQCKSAQLSDSSPTLFDDRRARRS